MATDLDFQIGINLSTHWCYYCGEPVAPIDAIVFDHGPASSPWHHKKCLIEALLKLEKDIDAITEIIRDRW